MGAVVVQCLDAMNRAVAYSQLQISFKVVLCVLGRALGAALLTGSRRSSQTPSPGSRPKPRPPCCRAGKLLVCRASVVPSSFLPFAKHALLTKS
uniref:Uncharacterized protein n=1 Tax=Scleropages formosus TaxID=113540 RepID=A0A8C9TVG6_SCLFO